MKRRILEYQTEGKKVVLCYGKFNALHVGHIRYIKKARKYGDKVVVALTPDDSFSQEDRKRFECMRAEALAHLDWIDAVAINTCDNWQDMMGILNPDVYAKGFESVHVGNEDEQEIPDNTFFDNLGIQYIIAKEDEFYSTIHINQYLLNYSEEVLNYIHLFKRRYDIQDLLVPLEKLRDLNVLVVGDTILDEYQYCSTIGKSSKDPTLALKYENHDIFAGGVLAVANHVAGFVNRVDLVSVLGDINSYEAFIQSKLRDNIRPAFSIKPNAPTIIKKRFVDGYSMNKLFEIYIMDDSQLDDSLDQELCRIVHEQSSNCDVVIVADYGHGTISRNMIDRLTSSSCFLAVNTQSNAGNRGFNTISKYSRANYVALAEHEIRLETRDIEGQLFPMMKNLADLMACHQFVVTRGKKGCMLFDRKSGLFQVPSFAQNIVDRVGAGDAFFASTALLSVLDVPGEILGFIGNVAGSLAVETMGNQKSIEKQRLIQYIRDLLN